MSEFSKSSDFKFWRVKDTKFKFEKNRVYLSFSKARERDASKLISILTNGPYSHADIIINGERYTALMDQGVGKFKLAENDLVTVFELSKDFDYRAVLNFFEKTKGNRYSFLNILEGQLLRSKNYHERNAYFCSQWVAEALAYSYKGGEFIINGINALERSHRINPNVLFKYISENMKRFVDNIKVTDSPFFESVPFSAYSEKYEINNGIYELYGPREKDFTDKKHIVSLCYRLMWNLKNTQKVREFDEIQSIYFDAVKGKPYGMVVLNNGKKYIFYLGNIYTPIPNEFNDKEIVVDPMEHNIDIYVNTKGDGLQEDIDSVRGGTNRSSWFNRKTKEEPKTEEEELLEDKDAITSEVVEDLVDENKDVIDSNIQSDEEKEKQTTIDKIKDVFEDKIVNGLIKKGLVRKDV